MGRGRAAASCTADSAAASARALIPAITGDSTSAAFAFTAAPASTFDSAAGAGTSASFRVSAAPAPSSSALSLLLSSNAPRSSSSPGASSRCRISSACPDNYSQINSRDC